MSTSNFFTKSLHKKAAECPTKLYYQGRPDLYENKSLDDPFLRALAYGGFQVGELARIYHAGGIEVTARDPQEALLETTRLLETENIVLYEAAIAFENFLVRADILVKRGTTLHLYEVKAKSIHPEDLDDFYDKKALKKQIYKLKTKWQPYFEDIAFQTMVCQKAFPRWTVEPHLILADKSQVASVNGLNQKFLIAKGDSRNKIKVAPGTDRTTVGARILFSLHVSEHVGRILADSSFEGNAQTWSRAWLSGEKIPPQLSKTCRSCEFRCEPAANKQSGFHECWTDKLRTKPEAGQLVIDLWNFLQADRLIEEGRLLLRDVTEEDLKTESKGAGLSTGQRQWVQVQKATARDPESFVDYDFLRTAISLWKWPLHCIDFETTAVAIPFHEGRRPYEQIAFQFSHHTISETGEVHHAGEYLHTARGQFPNFDFVRALKKDLETDEGTIFRYSNHENTILVAIAEQLENSQEPDRDELLSFIRHITRDGPREMVDLLEIVKKAYYNPRTRGSNSVKKVLPAVLAESRLLQDKYSQPIYGTLLSSRNYKAHTWLQRGSAGQLIDPYKQLPPLFDDIDPEQLEGFLSDDDEVADGGAAMMAFARMQFTEMSQAEFDLLRQGLLRYCELDTLAMVMLIEYFQDLVGQAVWKKSG